jgi:hypothetical protein
MEKRQSTKWKRIGQVGVDSGTVVIADPCYVDKLNYDENPRSTGPYPAIYGVISQSGYGDGRYPVYARMEGGRVMELRVVFDTPEANRFARHFGILVPSAKRRRHAKTA